MADLSIIIPFVNEYPQIVFTIKAIAEELIDRVDFEILAVDNYAMGYVDRPEDKSGEVVETAADHNPWLRYIECKHKLSHWNAKRIGVSKSTGNILLFCDSHVIPSRDSIFEMFNHYWNNWEELDGSLHLPVTYKILEPHKSIYKFLLDKGAFYDYRFTGFRESDKPYEVPCMSTCGMMIHKEFYNLTGGWHPEFGIYSGGEHFMNYTLAVLGKKKWIWPHGHLAHHGEKRGYSQNYDDTLRNRMLAHYLFGGTEVLNAFRNVAKGKPQVLNELASNVLKVGWKQRQFIETNQKMTIQEWVEKSTEKGLI